MFTPRTYSQSAIHFMRCMVASMKMPPKDSQMTRGVPLWCAADEATLIATCWSGDSRVPMTGYRWSTAVTSMCS